MLYVARTDDGRLKIGYSESLVRRTWQISVLFDQPVTLVALFPGTRDDENTLHERFKPYRVEVLATDRRVSRRETYRGESPVREWLDALPPAHRCEIRHDFRGGTTAITSQIKAHLAQFEVTSAVAARAAAGARLRAPAFGPCERKQGFLWLTQRARSVPVEWPGTSGSTGVLRPSSSPSPLRGCSEPPLKPSGATPPRSPVPDTALNLALEFRGVWRNP